MTRSEAGKLGAIKTRELGVNKKIHEKSIEQYYKNPLRCKECGKIIPYEKRRNSNFCSQSCSAVFNNKKRGFVSKPRTEPMFCIECGKEIDHRKANRKFCSLKCQGLHSRLERYREIERNGYFESGKTGEASRQLIRNYLIYKYGRKCSICGITEWCGKEVPVVVDHIDGNPYNNKIDNFRLVCGNCDMQLPTYKNRNRGNGRKLRRLKRWNG